MCLGNRYAHRVLTSLGDLVLFVNGRCLISVGGHRIRLPGLCTRRRYFPRAVWPCCQTHYQKNARTKVPLSARDEVNRKPRDMFSAPDLTFAQQLASRMIAEYEGHFLKVASWMEEIIYVPLAVFMIPEKHRKILRTINSLERYHRDVKRCTAMISIFPNRDSCMRLIRRLVGLLEN